MKQPVHIDALQLQVGITLVRTGGIDPVLVGHHLPELRSDLVAALAGLDADDLAHRGLWRKGGCECAVEATKYGNCSFRMR